MLRRLVAVLAVLALLAGGCSDEPADLEAELAEVFAATFEGPFAYRLSVDADREAIEALGEGAGAAASFLSGLGVEGVRGEGSFTLRLRVLGFDVLDVRSLDDDRLFARLGLGDLPIPGGLPQRDQVLPALQRLGLDEATQEAVVAALDGRWVGVDGPIDAGRLRSLLRDGREPVTPDEVQDAVGQVVAEDLTEGIRRFVEVEEHTQADGSRTFRVGLLVRDLLRAAADLSNRVGPRDVSIEDLEADLLQLPESVPGSVFVDDGRITRIRFDLAEAARRAGDEEVEGTIDLQLDLSDHGAPREPTAPPDPVVLDADRFLRALEQLASFAAGLG